MKCADSLTGILPVRTPPILLTIRAFARSCSTAYQKSLIYGAAIALTPAYSADSSLILFSGFSFRLGLHRH